MPFSGKQPRGRILTEGSSARPCLASVRIWRKWTSRLAARATTRSETVPCLCIDAAGRALAHPRLLVEEARLRLGRCPSGHRVLLSPPLVVLLLGKVPSSTCGCAGALPRCTVRRMGRGLRNNKARVTMALKGGGGGGDRAQGSAFLSFLFSLLRARAEGARYFEKSVCVKHFSGHFRRATRPGDLNRQPTVVKISINRFNAHLKAHLSGCFDQPRCLNCVGISRSESRVSRFVPKK